MRQQWVAATVMAVLGAGLAAPAVAQVTEEAQASAEPDQPQQRARQPRTIWQLGSGFSYSDGDYGHASNTEVVAIPANLRVRRGDWFARASISWVSIRGTASVIDTGLDGETETDSQGTPPGSTSQTRSGLGDLSLTAGRRLSVTESLQLIGDVRVKFPTASEAERLTTGTTDVTLRLRASQDIGNLTLRAGGRRRLAGGGGRVAVRDTWGLFGGASVDLGDGIAVGADYNWLQSSFAGNGPNSNVTGYLSAPIGRRVRVTGYGIAGLSTNSADVTVGTSITLRID